MTIPFFPKNTLQSVANEIATGLQDGDVTLANEARTDVDEVLSLLNSNAFFVRILFYQSFIMVLIFLLLSLISFVLHIISYFTTTNDKHMQSLLDNGLVLIACCLFIVLWSWLFRWFSLRNRRCITN